MFHQLGRFILVRSKESAKVVAFTSFRFEEEEGFAVVYWSVDRQLFAKRIVSDSIPSSYELHVSPAFHRCGIGRKLTQMLFDICRQRHLDKVMLTVFKGTVYRNHSTR